METFASESVTESTLEMEAENTVSRKHRIPTVNIDTVEKIRRSWNNKSRPNKKEFRVVYFNSRGDMSVQNLRDIDNIQPLQILNPNRKGRRFQSFFVAHNTHERNILPKLGDHLLIKKFEEAAQARGMKMKDYFIISKSGVYTHNNSINI